MEEKLPQEQLLRRLEERLLQPEVRHSAKAVGELLADDFIEFGSSGRVYNKAQIIESLQQEPPGQRSLLAFKTSVLAPGVVLATYRAVQQRAAGELPVTSLRSAIWKLSDGRWQMVFHQGTVAET